jgi:hypothetical protein
VARSVCLNSRGAQRAVERMASLSHRAYTTAASATAPGHHSIPATTLPSLIDFACCCYVCAPHRGLYNTALVARLVLTWFPNPPAFIAGPLA